MVGSDRLNVAAISISLAVLPFLVGVLHYVKYSEAFFAVSSAGLLSACPFCRL